MAKASPVTQRKLAPVQEVQYDENLLYTPVPQIEGIPPYQQGTEWITAEEAAVLLEKADSDPDFRQRPLRPASVRRFKRLLRTKRYVHYMPDGALCRDPDGMLLNGKHRLTAQVETGMPAGWVVVRNVPRWMFKFMDTPTVRTLKDVFHNSSRPTKAQTGAAMKLGMRYEEFLFGKRNGTGWRSWTTGEKDEHWDVDGFIARREELQGWYGTGEKVYGKTKLLIPSVMCFKFYQSLAWPDGDKWINEFLEGLLHPYVLPPSAPARALGKWSTQAFEYKEVGQGRRECHLMLLMRTFAMHVNKSDLGSIVWAYGMPMTMPYHPSGFEVAIKNVKEALDEMDALA